MSRGQSNRLHVYEIELAMINTRPTGTHAYKVRSMQLVERAMVYAE